MRKENGVLIGVTNDDLKLLKSNPKEFWEGVTKIGVGAFEYCSNLTSITIPDSVTEIRWNAFYGCSSLTSITIPNSVTKIGKYAFEDCSSLTSITIPDSVTEIGDFSFSGCSNLREIIIPEDVEVGENVFKDCPNLKITRVKVKTEENGENEERE